MVIQYKVSANMDKQHICAVDTNNTTTIYLGQLINYIEAYNYSIMF